MYFKKVTVIFFIVATLLSAFHSDAVAASQEGILHRVIRTVFEIPVAVLRSFQGPTCNDPNQDITSRIRYPDSRAIYGPDYRLNAQQEYEPLPSPPRYVTYKMMTPQKPENLVNTKANVHVYSSIPFSNR